MCGLVGIAARYANGFTQKEADMFQHMLFADTLRGWDSTGVFGVNKNGNVTIKKAALEGPDFIRTQEFKDFRTDIIRDGVFACGHNRAATRGQINDKNAHPFWVDDKIVLMQNGTMSGDHKKHKDVEVDTEAIAHVLNDCGGDIEKAMQKIDAAFALVWYNTETEELCLLRNTERPLYLSYFNDNGLVWASEGETILWAASRCDVKLKMEPYLLKEHYIVSMKLGEHGKYTVTHREVDTKYRGISFQGNWKTKYCGDSSGAFGCEQESHANEHVIQKTVPLLPMPLPQMEVPRRHSVRTFTDMLATDASLAQYLFSDILHAQKACKDIMNERDDHLNVIVEPIDFIPADLNVVDEKRNWYLFGWVPSPGDEPNQQVPLIYWFVREKTTQEMIELAHDSLFKVQLRTSVVQSIPHKKAVSAVFYGHNPEPVSIN